MSQTYQKAYENKPVWVNDHAPAINETRMNNISSALDTIDDRVIELQSEAKKLLASLDDTTISNPQNEDLLVYNSTTQKWENRVYSPGTFDYEELDNLPQINSVELVGDKSSEDLGLLEYQNITKAEMDILIEQGTWKHNTYYNITDESDMKDLIDDTSTTATDKSWSAKKSNDEISEINSTLTNYLKTKRVQVTPTPNAYIPPFTHYVTFDYSQYGITKDKIISIMVESTSTGSAVAYLGAGTSIHVHANTNDTRYVTIVYLGN